MFRASLLTTTALGGTITLALLWSAAPAQAACTPIAGAAGVPPAGTTVTCAGATVNQNALNGYGTGLQDGLTINVQSLASVRGTEYGMELRNGNTVNNSGAIIGDGADFVGIYPHGDLTLTNNTGATITGVLGGIAGDTSVIATNFGTISGTGADSIGLGATKFVNVTNNSGGLITGTLVGVGAGDVLVGVGAAALVGPTVGDVIAVNSGTISGTGSLSVGVGAINSVTVTNNSGGTITGGTIGVGALNFASVINSSGATISGGEAGVFAGVEARVLNSGTISGTGPVSIGVLTGGFAFVVSADPAYVTNDSGGLITGNLAGVASLGGDANVINSGTISGTGATVTPALFEGGSESVLGGGIVAEGIANVTNNAGGLITGVTAGILSGSANVMNFGTIAGGVGIDTLTFTNGAASTIFNAGTITGTGGTAIQFGGARNTLTIAPTSVINGNVLGTGSDTLQLGGSSGIGAFNLDEVGPKYQGFATFNKIDGSTWILSGTSNQVWNVLGGTLGGNATVGGLNILSGGTIAPGHSIGTFNVNGNVGFAAGSFYQVEVNGAGQSDRIVATGTATLLGGTVQVFPALGNYGLQTIYPILTAQGGVTGTFDGLSVTTGSIFFTSSLSYGPTQVLLTLKRLPFSSFAQTPNQFNVATALETVNLSGALGAALFALPDGASARRAFDALSGEIHPTVAGIVLDESRYMRQAILARLRQGSYAGEAGLMASLASGDSLLAYQAQPPAARMAGFPVKAPAPAPAPANFGTTWWAQGLGAWGNADSDGNAAGFKRQLAGILTGADASIAGAWRGGLATGYTQSQIDVSDRLSSARVDTAHLGIYAGGPLNAFNLRTGAAFAWHSIATERDVAFPGFLDRESARYSGYIGQVFGELGYGIAMGAFALEPFAGLAWASRHTDDFIEAGGAAALYGTDGNQNVGYSTVGIRAATRIARNDMVLIPRASLAWQSAFGEVKPNTTFTFASGSSPFMIFGIPIARDSALVEAGLDVVYRPNFTLGVSYVGQFGSGGVQDNAVKGKATWTF